MSTFSNENHVTRGFTSDAINEFAFRLLSQFFLGNSGPLKRQNEQRTQYFRDYEKSKCSRQFLKEWKQNVHG